MITMAMMDLVPGSVCAANNGDGTYRLDLQDGTSRLATDSEVLSSVRSELWEQIKIERDRRIQEQGYVAGGKRFHGDTFSRTQQMGLVMLGAGIPPGLQWKTMDGSFITMTPTLAQQIFAAAAASDIALFGHAEALRAQVNAAEDPSSVDITAGWPA